MRPTLHKVKVWNGSKLFTHKRAARVGQPAVGRKTKGV